nr:immunoglobulin light chain junction region [Macaca mulatta]
DYYCAIWHISAGLF